MVVIMKQTTELQKGIAFLALLLRLKTKFLYTILLLQNFGLYNKKNMKLLSQFEHFYSEDKWILELEVFDFLTFLEE